MNTKTGFNKKLSGQRILKSIRAEVNRDKLKKLAPEINYSDHCDWHDAGTGDCKED